MLVCGVRLHCFHFVCGEDMGCSLVGRYVFCSMQLLVTEVSIVLWCCSCPSIIVSGQSRQ